MPHYILDLDVTLYKIINYTNIKKPGDILLGYTNDASLFPLFNKINRDDMYLYLGNYTNNHAADVVYGNISTGDISINKGAHIYSNILLRQSYKYEYLYKTEDYFIYLYNQDKIGTGAYDIPYDFSSYSILKLDPIIYDNKNYVIIREDLQPGGWYTRTINKLYPRFSNYANIAIIFNGVYKYLLAEIYVLLSMPVHIYIFSLIKSKSLVHILNKLDMPTKITYIYLHKRNKMTASEMGTIYKDNEVLTEVRKYIKTEKIVNIKLLSSPYFLEKYNILRDNLMHSIPSIMLSAPSRIWILYEPNNYIDKIFEYIYSKLSEYSVTILQIKISLDKFPGEDTEKICRRNNIYYLRDSIYKSIDNDIIFNMNKHTEKKYFEVIKHFGQNGDYILNYIGDYEKQINLIKDNYNYI